VRQAAVFVCGTLAAATVVLVPAVGGGCFKIGWLASKFADFLSGFGEFDCGLSDFAVEAAVCGSQTSNGRAIGSSGGGEICWSEGCLLLQFVADGVGGLAARLVGSDLGVLEFLVREGKLCFEVGPSLFNGGMTAPFTTCLGKHSCGKNEIACDGDDLGRSMRSFRGVSKLIPSSTWSHEASMGRLGSHRCFIQLSFSWMSVEFNRPQTACKWAIICLAVMLANSVIPCRMARRKMWSTQPMICCMMALSVVSHSQKMRRAAVWLCTMNAVLVVEVPAGEIPG
jgi:hypothetical protein